LQVEGPVSLIGAAGNPGIHLDFFALRASVLSMKERGRQGEEGEQRQRRRTNRRVWVITTRTIMLYMFVGTLSA